MAQNKPLKSAAFSKFIDESMKIIADSYTPVSLLANCGDIFKTLRKGNEQFLLKDLLCYICQVRYLVPNLKLSFIPSISAVR
jgi:hypothetical protein